MFFQKNLELDAILRFLWGFFLIVNVILCQWFWAQMFWLSCSSWLGFKSRNWIFFCFVNISKKRVIFYMFFKVNIFSVFHAKSSDYCHLLKYCIWKIQYTLSLIFIPLVLFLQYQVHLKFNIYIFLNGVYKF